MSEVEMMQEEPALAVTEEEGKVIKPVDEEAGEEMEEDGGLLGNWTWREVIYNGLAVAALGTSAAAMVLEGGLIVNSVSALCALLGPAAAVKQSRLVELDGLRVVSSQLRGEVARMKSENERLTAENERLEGSIEKLKGVEDTLAELSKAQKGNIDLMISQIQEFKQIQEDVKANLKARIIQDLISYVIISDTDGDALVDSEEVEGLIMRLDAMPGFELNEKNFRAAMAGSGYSLHAVLDMVKNLLDDTVSEEDNIFMIDTTQLRLKDVEEDDLHEIIEMEKEKARRKQEEAKNKKKKNGFWKFGDN